MNIIIKKEYFDCNNIKINTKPNKAKITYLLNNITILGIPIQINNFTIQGTYNNILIINIRDSPDKYIIYKIDKYFKELYGLRYKSFIQDDTLRVLIYNYFYKEKLLISFKNIIFKDSFFMVQIFTI